MQEIPIDMDLKKQWRNHDIVTDSMVKWFKKNCGCEPYHGIKDVDEESHLYMFNKSIPINKIAWMKIDISGSGRLNIFKNNLVYTDLNGRNPLDYNMQPINLSD